MPKRQHAIFALLVVGVASMIAARLDSPAADRASAALLDTVAPLLHVVNSLSKRVETARVNLEAFLDRQGEVNRLQRELEELRGWRERAERLEEENASLRRMNGVQPTARDRFITAQVVGGSHGPFVHSVIADAGSADRILDGATVVDGNGLVGRVIGLTNEYSRVLLLTDLSSDVPVYLPASNVHAILDGDGSERPLLSPFQNAHNIHVGDRLFTSGRGEVFKEEILVGRVDEISQEEIRVSLAADFSELAFVRILDPARPSDIPMPAVVVPAGSVAQTESESQARRALRPETGQPHAAAEDGAAPPASRPPSFDVHPAGD